MISDSEIDETGVTPGEFSTYPLDDSVNNDQLEKPWEPASRRETRFARLVRRTVFLVLILGVPIGLLLYLPHLAWKREAESALAIRIVDKTVPFVDRREHRGLFWLLGQNRIICPDKGPEDRYYDYRTDYIGAYPTEGGGLTDYSFLSFGQLAGYDALYLADTYGVYSDDYSTRGFDPDKLQLIRRERSHTDFSKLLFGGLTEAEVIAIENFACFDKLIIAEFNTFATPTKGHLRDRMEQVLGISWSGWSGRYFTDFSNEDDVPAWFYDMYESREGRDLRSIGGSGFILVHDLAQDFILLRDGEELAAAGVEFIPRITPAADSVMEGVSESQYNYWLDIVEPHLGTEVLADYRFNLTPEGQRLMQAAGLNPEPPAVLRKANVYTSYYLAGDMCDYGQPMGPFNTKLTLFLSRHYFSSPVKGSNGEFFWHSYYPMVTNILRSRAHLSN